MPETWFDEIEPSFYAIADRCGNETDISERNHRKESKENDNFCYVCISGLRSLSYIRNKERGIVVEMESA
jgi:hypothetical protein